MEDFCNKCEKQADATCTCDSNLRFCYKHIMKHLVTMGDQHKSVNLRKLQDKFYNLCKFNLEKLNQTKSALIYRSKKMIEAILSITKTQLSRILSNYDEIKSILKNKNFSDAINQTVQEYGNIKINESELDEFNECANGYLSLIINESESLLSELNDGKTEESINKIKVLESKISNFKVKLNKQGQKYENKTKTINKHIIDKDDSIPKIIKKLENDYNIFLEGHKNFVLSVVITSDNKYIISAS